MHPNLEGVQFAIFFFASESDCLQILVSHGKLYNTMAETTVSIPAVSFPSINVYSMVSKINSGIILFLYTTCIGKATRDKLFYINGKRKKYIVEYVNALL